MRRVIAALALTIAVVIAVLLYRSPPVQTTSVATPQPTPSPTGSAVTVQTFTGPVVKAYQRKIGYVFGDVQVVVTVRHGLLVAINTPLLPPVGDTGGRGTRPTTASITQFALPILRHEALLAQSANIQSVSGATFTSGAFMRSLQAALLQVSR